MSQTILDRLDLSPKRVHANLSSAELVERALAAGEGQLAANGALGLADGAGLDRFPLPSVEPKDPVRFGDHLPALQVADLGAALFSLAHLGANQRCR
jgi:hypothetical protein